MRFSGDVAELGIIQEGLYMKVICFATTGASRGQPSYLIIAGLVCPPLSGPLIDEEHEDSIGRCFSMVGQLKLLVRARYSLARLKGEEMVILSQGWCFLLAKNFLGLIPVINT
ncbi:protease Do-like 2, chloroplastic isoform X3 [Phoenix dactylifera]|uniref:Protease Do-like 2, chloroplastic isoform X3 n=1 Tax=Phoenix dactylifera TaxID=42345 RepID=A0A8B8J014_PHODC|nr:protease Do-like 2, chloroplastic isoform X3 [Phoenix dactylifera]